MRAKECIVTNILGIQLKAGNPVTKGIIVDPIN